MEQKKITFKDLPKNIRIIVIVVIAILSIYIGVLAVRQSDEDMKIEANKISIIDRHFKKFNDVRFWGCETSAIDTAQLIEYAQQWHVKGVYIDYFIFNTPNNPLPWFEKFKSVDEANNAIYNSNPDLIINVLNGDIMIMPKDYFKPY